MKKIKLLLFVQVCIITLFGCMQGLPAKSPITSDDFMSRMNALGFTVSHAQNENERIEIVLHAENPTKSYTIEFVKFKRRAQAKSVFEEQEGTIEEFATRSSGFARGSNWSRKHGSSDEQFALISYIDDTFVSVVAPAEYEDESWSIIRGLGY